MRRIRRVFPSPVYRCHITWAIARCRAKNDRVLARLCGWFLAVRAWCGCSGGSCGVLGSDRRFGLLALVLLAGAGWAVAAVGAGSHRRLRRSERRPNLFMFMNCIIPLIACAAGRETCCASRMGSLRAHSRRAASRASATTRTRLHTHLPQQDPRPAPAPRPHRQKPPTQTGEEPAYK